ncbi:MAG TPA: hypothetical protein VFX53_15180 [Pedococcus sp.]|nr:hypothetical protein [Pedococcus sp.]
MSDKPKDDEQVPGGDLSGNEDGASSDGDSGPEGACGANEGNEHGADDDEAAGQPG